MSIARKERKKLITNFINSDNVKTMSDDLLEYNIKRQVNSLNAIWENLFHLLGEVSERRNKTIDSGYLINIPYIEIKIDEGFTTKTIIWGDEDSYVSRFNK